MLAAVGTTLPETIIPVIAILGAAFTGGDPQLAGEISISLILGAPFLLATLGIFMIGALMLGFKRRRRHDVSVDIDEAAVRGDVGFFIIFFAVAGASGVVKLPLWAKIALVVILVGANVFH